MHLLGFLLLPIALTMGRHVRVGNFAFTIENNTVTEESMTGEPPKALDLSNLNLGTINLDLFTLFSELKTLNLSNNSITQLPKLLSSTLPNLEELNLANNNLDSVIISGFPKLKTLNISNNGQIRLEAGSFFGTSRSVKILTQGDSLEHISPLMFEDPSEIPSSPVEHFQEMANPAHGRRTNHPRFQVCIQNGHLNSLEEWKTGETLMDGCLEARVTPEGFELAGLSIKTFQSGWFRVQNPKYVGLSLANNKIVKITKEVLNDLPEEITMVSLANNKIERLDAGIMERASPLKMLNLEGNLISEIEDGALEKLNLTNVLFLNNNKLSSTKFVKSLPKIKYLSLSENNIEEIEKGSFKNMDQLLDLDMGSNPLKNLRKGAFAGLPKSLDSHVSIGGSDIQTIECDLFLEA